MFKQEQNLVGFNSRVKFSTHLFDFPRWRLGECKAKTAQLETAKLRLEDEVQGWMETVMEVRQGRMKLLNHIDTISDKVCKNVFPLSKSIMQYLIECPQPGGGGGGHLRY